LKLAISERIEISLNQLFNSAVLSPIDENCWLLLRIFQLIWNLVKSDVCICDQPAAMGSNQLLFNWRPSEAIRL